MAALPREPGRTGLRPRPLVVAAAIAFPLAAVVAFVFALRAGAVAFPLLTFLFWRGASLGRLLGAAGALLVVVVPAVYALFPPDDLGGHNSSYATELLGAHWIAVAAVVLLAHQPLADARGQAPQEHPLRSPLRVTAPQDSRPLLSVVIPVLDEADGLPELRRRLNEQLGQIDGPTEVIYVDDGSTDNSAALVESYIASGDQAVLVVLSRNFGMDIAMSAGLDEARGEYVALMHADLQDPPELIPQMLAAAREGADVVYARRIGRDESRDQASARDRLLPDDGAARARSLPGPGGRLPPDEPPRRRGHPAHARAAAVPARDGRLGRATSRFRSSTGAPAARRAAGASYPELIRLALEALTSFSDVPLSLVGYAGVGDLGAERARGVRAADPDHRRGR